MGAGEEFEQEVFGRDHRLMMERIPLHESFAQAMESVVARHGRRHLDPIRWDCRKQATLPARRLYWYVSKWLPQRYRTSLRLFNAIGTSLDYWHGIDAFFWWRDGRPRKRRSEPMDRIATLDLATYQKASFKADFLVTPEIIYSDQIRSLGWKIADQLLGRYVPPGFRSELPDSRIVLAV